MPGLLFDASSLVYALKTRRLSILLDNYVLDLTRYEVLNAFWKEAVLLKRISIEEAVGLAAAAAKAIGFMRVLSIDGLEEEVVGTAAELGLTAYDASYVVAAERHGLTLVTEDRRLAEKASRRIRVMGLDEAAAGERG